MPRCRPLTLLLAAVALAIAAPAAAGAAKHPSAKRCKAVKAHKHKTKRDRAVLKRCAKAETAGKKKRATTPTPVVPPAPAGPVGPLAPVEIAPVPDTAAAPTPTPSTAPVVTPTPTPAVPEIPVGTGRAVQVRGFEFGLNLSRAVVLSGTVRVEYNLTSAEDPHTLVVSRADGTGTSYRFDEQGSRSVVAKSLPLSAGRWRLVCDLPGHAAAGMQVELDVR